MVSSLLTFLSLGWAGLSSAHLIMKSPVPFGTSTLNNSPLADAAIGSAGSDFPCKQRAGVYDITTMNNMAVGDTQTLSFTGSASHGGGTCQLAVSLDLEPTANSTWKLIQVYEGGCPITAAGNAGTDTFTYKIPQNFPNGKATLAWTWFNRVGNREIYMNCAPITVTGGADNQDYYNTLPDMYIINLPTSQCSTVESTNQIIPNPGQFVLKGDTADKLSEATGPACAAAAAAQTQGVQEPQSAPASGSASTADSSSTATAAAAAAATTTAANNGQYTPPVTTAAATVNPSSAAISSALAMTVPSGLITMPSGSNTTPISLTVVPPSSSMAAVASSSPLNSPPQPVAGSPSDSNSTNAGSPSNSGSPGTGSGSSSGSSGSSPNSSPDVSSGNSTAAGSGSTSVSSSSCPTDGALVCNGPTRFGLCNFGQVVWQDVATGTTCSNGAIQK